MDLERAAVWLYSDGKNEFLPLEEDAGYYDCEGPIEAVIRAARGEEFINQSPGELGARTVEALEVAYKSADSGKLESR